MDISLSLSHSDSPATAGKVRCRRGGRRGRRRRIGRTSLSWRLKENLWTSFDKFSWTWTSSISESILTYLPTHSLTHLRPKGLLINSSPPLASPLSMCQGLKVIYRARGMRDQISPYILYIKLKEGRMEGWCYFKKTRESRRRKKNFSKLCVFNVFSSCRSSSLRSRAHGWCWVRSYI